MGDLALITIALIRSWRSAADGHPAAMGMRFSKFFLALFPHSKPVY